MQKQKEVSFKVADAERAIIEKILDRCKALGLHRMRIDIEMDLEATHSNGCPLDFEKLLAFDDFNFLHDIGGIAVHLDRSTGVLGDFFLPRSAKKQ